MHDSLSCTGEIFSVIFLKIYFKNSALSSFDSTSIIRWVLIVLTLYHDLAIVLSCSTDYLVDQKINSCQEIRASLQKLPFNLSAPICLSMPFKCVAQRCPMSFTWIELFTCFFASKQTLEISMKL